MPDCHANTNAAPGPRPAFTPDAVTAPIFEALVDLLARAALTEAGEALLAANLNRKPKMKGAKA